MSKKFEVAVLTCSLVLSLSVSVWAGCGFAYLAEKSSGGTSQVDTTTHPYSCKACTQDKFLHDGGCALISTSSCTTQVDEYHLNTYGSPIETVDDQGNMHCECPPIGSDSMEAVNGYQGSGQGCGG